ncbi:MAG: hypothetical protein E3J81_03170 [Dehalococcoidia bacterium]|nr:MAG: hypothetical protein E3J81_03170 [Dehalococcoidia bacterium]
MITLEAADLIEGDASAANVVDYTINGAQVDSSRNVDVKALADGQLAGSKATLYTTPASTTAIVKSITLVNTDSSARTVNLYVQRDGTNSRRIIPENLTLEANGGSLLLSGNGLQVFSASGEVLYALSSHATDHVTGASDEVDGDKLDIDWNPTNYTPTTTPSEADNVDNLTAHLYGIDQELGQKLENVVEDVTPQLGGDLDCQSNKFTNMLGFLMKAATELTIASGAVTVTQMFHTVDTEGDAATDDLDTINGGTTVNLIILRAENDARTVVVKHNTGNIWLQGKADINLDDLEDGIMLVWDSTNSKWFDIAAGGGGGAAHAVLDGSTHNDSVADAVTRGSIIYGNATPKWDELVVGAAGKVLKSDGTDIAWGDIGLYTEGARVYHNANQSIPSGGASTPLAFNSERYDTDAIHDPSSNNDRLTCKTAGKYLIWLIVEWAANATGIREGGIFMNGTTWMGFNRAAGLSSGGYGGAFAISCVYDMAVNDYVKCRVWQDSGGALNIVAVAQTTPEFGMQRIG